MSINDKVAIPQKIDTNTIKSKQSSQIPLSNYQTIFQRVRMYPQSMTDADAMILQRTIGNQAVGMLMRELELANDNSKPVQREALHEEDEVLHGKFNAIQREEKEPVQMKEEMPIQMMMYKTGLFNSFPSQITEMSCWAAAIAAVAGLRQDDIIASYKNERYDQTGLPPEKDYSVIVEHYGLMKIYPWEHAIRPDNLVAMIALPNHWVVSYGAEFDETEKMVKICYFDPWDGSTHEYDIATFTKDKQPTVAYKKVTA